MSDIRYPASLENRHVGIIGLGNMGAAISANLVEAGWCVSGFDKDAGRCEEAARAGVRIEADPAAVAARARTVITSLPSFAAASAVLAQISRSSPSLIVETSTFSVAEKEQLRGQLDKSGSTLLDCPISGTSAQARLCDVVIYASGPPDSIAACTPLFEDFGKVRPVGPFGNGTRFKILANLLVAIHNVAAAECIALGRRAGLNLEMLVEVLGLGAGSSRMLQVRGPMMASERFTPATMRLDLWRKDLDIIAAFNAQVEGTVPLFEAAEQLYDTAIARGWGDEDTAVVYRLLTE